jgi:hypothetical protein
MTTTAESVRERLARQRQARDEEIVRYREWRERQERRLRAARAARDAAALKAAPPPPAASGMGWRVLESPRVSHEVLEAHARAMWAFVWHESDFPDWRIRWGALDPILLSLAGAADRCAHGLFGTVLGLCVMTPRIILIDEQAQRYRTPRQFATTLIHELIHSQQRDVAHGPRFEAALRAATDYFFGGTDTPAPVLARPEPPKGVRFRPGGFLDSPLEYRG